jgi:hypothetical protein
MNTNRRSATIVGVLFIIATLTGVLGVALTAPIVYAPDYLSRVSANADQFTSGAFVLFIMAAACAGIGISLYPVLAPYDRGLALGAAGFRIIEGVLEILGGVIGLLLLVTLSQEFVSAGAPDQSYFATLGALLIAGRDCVNNAAVMAWCLGALMYYYIFYRTQLVPRWLSGWGLVGITLAFLASTLVMFRLATTMGTLQNVLDLPIALQEMVLAVWLIVKGFHVASVVPEGSARAVPTLRPTTMGSATVSASQPRPPRAAPSRSPRRHRQAGLGDTPESTAVRRRDKAR